MVRTYRRIVMAKKRILTEDEVRDGYTDSDGFHKGAKQILEFDKP